MKSFLSKKDILSGTSDEQVRSADEYLSFVALKHDGIVGFIQVSISHLIDRVIEDGKPFGITQIRAWSAIDREESILFWKEKGFMLCHAIRFEQERSGDIEGFYAVKKV